MAQIILAPSYENRSTLPFSTNAGAVLQHRCAFAFAVATALAKDDLIVFGTLKEGYQPVSVSADSDGIGAGGEDGGLTADILLVDDLESPKTSIVVAEGLSFADQSIVSGDLTLEAIRYKGLNQPMYLVAKVTTAVTAPVNSEIAVTFSYRYRQSTD